MEPITHPLRALIRALRSQTLPESLERKQFVFSVAMAASCRLLSSAYMLQVHAELPAVMPKDIKHYEMVKQ